LRTGNALRPRRPAGDPLLHHAVAEACREALGEQPAREPMPVLLPAPPANRHVLVAEDHPVNRALIARQLDRLGYTHTVVEDGERALAVLAAGGIDLLITDCHMPGLDGLALTRRIRAAEPSGRHLPVIALSASALPEQARRCLEAGADDFLAKPVRLDQLAGKLAHHLRPSPASQSVLEPQPAPQAVFPEGDDGDLIPELVAACREDLARLDRLPASALVARRELLHRMEGALALVAPVPEGDVFAADVRAIGQREQEIRERVAFLEASLLQDDHHASARANPP
jgi:CheY-like chemotaxis protein